MHNHQARLARIQEACVKWGVPHTSCWLAASIAHQRLYCYYHESEGCRHQRTYAIATSKLPPSCIKDSYGTPLGLHQICEKIGDGTPLGTVFDRRVPTQKRYWETQEHASGKALITSRILRLRGLEPQRNQGNEIHTGACCDTLERCVYVHGTNLEYNIRTPSSHGCILLTNHDMLDLYNRVHVGSILWIEE